MNPTKPILLLSLSLSLLLSCRKELPKGPIELSTKEVTEITTTSVTAGGLISDDKGTKISTRGVLYSTTQNPTMEDYKAVSVSQNNDYSVTINYLAQNTTYYARAYVINENGFSYGQQLTFKTAQYTSPILTTVPISNITPNTATSGGEIISNGWDSIIAKGVCWSIAPNPTIVDNITTDGSGNDSFISQLESLTHGTTYYVRAYATNSLGTGYGNELSFTATQLYLATVITTAVTVTSHTTATSGGNVTNDGGNSVTKRGVCWHTSPNPTIDHSTTDNGNGTGNFTSPLTGLTPNTTYYLRAYATNGAGTAYGNEFSFTPSWPCGIGGDLTVNSGEVLELAAGQIYDYNNVTIHSGGILRFTGNTTAFTIFGVKGNLNLQGTIECKNSTSSGLKSQITPDGVSVTHTITQKNGGSGGNGGRGRITTDGIIYTGPGGVGQAQSGGNGGGAGGGGGAAHKTSSNGGSAGSAGGNAVYDGSPASNPGSSISASPGSNGNLGSNGSYGGGHGGSTRYNGDARLGGGGGARVMVFLTGQAFGGGGGGGGAKGSHGKNLYIRCKGTFDGTGGTIDVSGGNGGNGRNGGASAASTSAGGGGGGGAGAGGSAGKVYIRHSGALNYTAATYTVTAGAAGTSGIGGTTAGNSGHAGTNGSGGSAAQAGDAGATDVSPF